MMCSRKEKERCAPEKDYCRGSKLRSRSAKSEDVTKRSGG